jgi:periplasmic protein TonB
MSTSPRAIAEVFSVQEIARAAGASAADVRGLLDSGRLRTLDGTFVAPPEAIRAVRLLRGTAPAGRRELFALPARGVGSAGRGIVGSTLVHGATLAVLVIAASLGVQTEMLEEPLISPARLVFLATKGPGGGGGGGGLKMPAPPRRAEMKGASTLRSPVPPPRPITTRKPEPKVERPLTPPVRPTPAPKPVEPPPPAPAPPEPMPQVVAPVVASAADPRDKAGVLDSASGTNSQGPGSGGGAGTGQGTGMGEGDGSGIGPGSGGGTGGGPYRPGSGITPPGLLREVKPEYTQEGRRRGTEGDVVLEIVVQRDGSVGDVKVVQRLGSGLDERAVAAVRQWRFSPARRYGTPVDVIVEVAVEFKLR